MTLRSVNESTRWAKFVCLETQPMRHSQSFEKKGSKPCTVESLLLPSDKLRIKVGSLILCPKPRLQSLTARNNRRPSGVNFTAYQQFKKLALTYQPNYQAAGELPSWQTMIIGLVSGAMGPFSNAPIDTIKT